MSWVLFQILVKYCCSRVLPWASVVTQVCPLRTGLHICKVCKVKILKTCLNIGEYYRFCSVGLRRPASYPDRLVCFVCPAKRVSSFIFALVEPGFTWGQSVLDNTLLSLPYLHLNYNQSSSLQGAEGVHTKHTFRPPVHPCRTSGDPAKFDKRPQLRRGVSVTGGYWLSYLVICFRDAKQLISHEETRQTLLDYYSERLSVSLRPIPYLIHLSFTVSLQTILVIFNSNRAKWRRLLSSIWYSISLAK